ncbi:MAG: zinc ribbon domain-containing protein [Chloroflexi bacterium]|nr:zinc ribbon domain-containing protein [Chloroflexota bacterium]
MGQQPAPASPMFWRFKPEVFRLIGMKCPDCGHITYPRSKICPECGSFKVKEYQLPKTGKVHTFCINWTPPPGLEAPIVNIIVDLDGGGKYMGLITEAILNR